MMTQPVEPLPMIHTEGTRWVDANGQEVLLKGVNLGNWLLQEFWMMGQSTEAVNDQCTLEALLIERFGVAEKERLMTHFRDHWMTERDWDLLASFGFNVVRLPFIYHLLEDEETPYTLREDAWMRLDEALREAEARGMYVILDLHGVVGSQWDQHTTGCEGQNDYWTNAEYQGRTLWLWQQIAARYKDTPTVAGYSLVNEPWGTTADNMASVMLDLYDAVRAVDPNHTIILPGHNTGIDAYGAPKDRGLENVAFEMHFYPGYFGWGSVGLAVHDQWLHCLDGPNSGVCGWDQRLKDLDAAFLVGEFQPWAGLGEQGGAVARATYDTYAQYGWVSTAWAQSGDQQRRRRCRYVGDGDRAARGFDEHLVAANTWDCRGWDSSFCRCLRPTTGAVHGTG